MESNRAGGGCQVPVVSGWKQVGEIQTFDPNTLYEYIDGGADLYLAYDFEELKVAEYQNGQKGLVTVEVYRHRTATHAFGVYSQERVPGANFIDVGVQGYLEKHALNFLWGNTYVKITGYDIAPEDQATLPAFARRCRELGRQRRPSSILTAFPAEGKIRNSEKFTARKFLGYPFSIQPSARVRRFRKELQAFHYRRQGSGGLQGHGGEIPGAAGMKDKTVAEGSTPFQMPIMEN